MTEPTAQEIERVAVAIVDEEMRIAGATDVMRQLAATLGRAMAVELYGSLARAAIIALRGDE